MGKGWEGLPLSFYLFVIWADAQNGCEVYQSPQGDWACTKDPILGFGLRVLVHVIVHISVSVSAPAGSTLVWTGSSGGKQGPQVGCKLENGGEVMGLEIASPTPPLVIDSNTPIHLRTQLQCKEKTCKCFHAISHGNSQWSLV